MLYEIKNYWTDKVIASAEGDSLLMALQLLVNNKTGLSGARLRDARLSGADLRGADLSGADLRDARLRGARLSGARLSGADLRDARLSGARLSGDDLRGADLSGARLSGDDLRGAEIPIVPQLHVKTLEAIQSSQNPSGGLEMGSWHTCETTHCRAGWYITLAGEAGRKLESRIGPAAAGALIALKSCPWMERVPNFYASNTEALGDIKACAARERAEMATCEMRKS